MLERLGHVLGGRKKRSPEQRLQSALQVLADGWSLEAFRDLESCAEDGMPEAQYELGRRYEEALGVVQNLADAVHWYRQAAQNSHLKAQSRLGLIYLSAPPPSAAVSGTAGPDNKENESQIFSTLGNVFAKGFNVKQDFTEAFKWNLCAAQGGDPQAQARLGQQYLAGLGTTADIEQGHKWLQQSVQHGCAEGLIAMGMLYANAWDAGVDPQWTDLPRALRCFQDAARQGHVTAQYQLGVLLVKHPSLIDDKALDTEERSPLYWLEMAAEAGHEDAMAQLGRTYWRGPLAARDKGRAETWLRRATGRGHVQAMRWLAQLLLEQPGQDGSEAANLMRQAAEEGDAPAAGLLAELYLKGHGVPLDATEAEKWLKRAGADARPRAMTALARLQTHHTSDKQNYDQAAQWLQKAAESGSLAAKFTIGSLYYQGKGVMQDLAHAARWFQEAASVGSVSGAFYLGLIYARADSPIHDDVQALRWFTVAAQGGHGHAICNAASMILAGRGQPSNPKRAVMLLEIAAAQGNVNAAEMLADWYATGRQITRNLDRAGQLLAQAALLGSTRSACLLIEGVHRGFAWQTDWYRLQQMLLKRLETAEHPRHKRDVSNSTALDIDVGDLHLALARLHQGHLASNSSEETMMAHVEKAAAAGLAEAQWWLGQHLLAQLEPGSLSPEQLSEAWGWFEKAAKQGHVGALADWTRSLGQLDAQDRTPQEDRLFEYWLQAAERGHAEAQRHVGQWYMEGRGVRRNAQTAVHWLTLAARQGDQAACTLLSECHAQGTGTPASPALARWWLEQAQVPEQVPLKAAVPQ